MQSTDAPYLRHRTPNLVLNIEGHIHSFADHGGGGHGRRHPVGRGLGTSPSGLSASILVAQSSTYVLLCLLFLIEYPVSIRLSYYPPRCTAFGC